MSSEQFSLYWDNFHKNMSMGMQSLLETKDLVDVTLAVEGRYLKAHKMVLSVCSPYFRELFQSNPCKHPIVFMKDVSYVALNDLLHFMYLGEAQVAQENFSTFMQTAEALQITGLTGDGAAQMTCESGQQSEKNTVETSAKRSNDAIDQNTNNTTQSITSIPASKRQKCSNVSTPSKTPSPVPSTVKYEFTSDNLQSDLDIKVEHDDNIQETEEHDGNQEECINESVLFKMNEDADFLLMESGSDDPRPTTSTDPGDDQEVGEINSMKLLPEKSRKQYETAYKAFMDWRTFKNIDSFSETVLLSYFEELGAKYKCSSLFAVYSMLRSTLNLNHTVNIEQYSKLRGFLKRKSEGYRAKTSKAFTADDINKFIIEAPDNIYLATKVAFIMGIMGACQSMELHAMNVQHIQDLGSAMLVTIPNTRTKTCRKFTVTGRFYKVCKKYSDLRPLSSISSSFFLNYHWGKCTSQNIGINKFKQMGKEVAKYLKLPNPEMYTGHSFRKSSAGLVLDESGNITLKRRTIGVLQ